MKSTVQNITQICGTHDTLQTRQIEFYGKPYSPWSCTHGKCSKLIHNLQEPSRLHRMVPPLAVIWSLLNSCLKTQNDVMKQFSTVTVLQLAQDGQDVTPKWNLSSDKLPLMTSFPNVFYLESRWRLPFKKGTVEALCSFSCSSRKMKPKKPPTFGLWWSLGSVLWLKSHFSTCTEASRS